jgi:hypothetical protein
LGILTPECADVFNPPQQPIFTNLRPFGAFAQNIFLGADLKAPLIPRVSRQTLRQFHISVLTWEFLLECADVFNPPQQPIFTNLRPFRAFAQNILLGADLKAPLNPRVYRKTLRQFHIFVLTWEFLLLSVQTFLIPPNNPSLPISGLLEQLHKTFS